MTFNFAKSRQVLMSGLYAGAVTGCFYGFGMYSSALQAQFNLSIQSLENVNTLPYCFGLLSPLIGNFAIKYGNKAALVLGNLL